MNDTDHLPADAPPMCANGCGKPVFRYPDFCICEACVDKITKNLEDALASMRKADR